MVRKGNNALSSRTGVGLDVNTPYFWIEMECLESTLPAENLELVDPLVTAVVTSVGETLGVLVGKNGAVGFHGCPTGQVLIL